MYQMNAFSQDVVVTDCLVFKLEEIESDSNNIDNEIFIIYDKKDGSYLIRGRRASTKKREYCPFSYECLLAKGVADFINYLVCPSNRVNEILYNYDNLPQDPNEITFDFLKECEDHSYEISGYNNEKLKKTRLLRILRMIRKVSNYY
jgi:hypothetical protein